MLLSYIRDFVPPFYLGLAVGILRAAGTRMRQHPVPRRAVSVYLQYGYLRLAVGILSAAGTRMPWHPVPRRAVSVYLRYGFLDLQSADFFRFFIRNLRYSFDLLSGFTRDEYHVIRVDFIVALRRTKGRGRRTLRSPPSPSSGLHLIHPGVSATAGKCRLPRAYRDIVSLYPVQTVHPHFDVSFGCLVFGLGLFAFQ